MATKKTEPEVIDTKQLTDQPDPAPVTTAEPLPMPTRGAIAAPIAVPGSEYTAEFAAAKVTLASSHVSQIAHYALFHNLRQNNGEGWTAEAISEGLGSGTIDSLLTEIVKANFEMIKADIYAPGRDPMKMATAGVINPEGAVYAVHGPYVRTSGDRDSQGRQDKVRTNRHGQIVKK